MPIEPEHLGWLIKRVQHAHHRALDTRLARLGASLVQWNALREIERNPGCSQHELAERTFNSDQAFGTLTTRLQARGWVERGEGKGRATTHRLTAKGKALLHGGQEVMAEVLATSFASLDRKEREQLASLLTRVLDAQRAESEAREPASRASRA
jgi:DNA-binding MarR family transcriptional regulator